MVFREEGSVDTRMNKVDYTTERESTDTIVSKEKKESNMLSGVVANHNDGKLADIDEYRRYVSSMSMSVIINNKNDVADKTIMYEIGMRSGLGDDGMMRPLGMLRGRVSRGLSQTIPTNLLISAQLEAASRRVVHFSGRYDYCDLAAIGYQLAKSVAFYVKEGKLSVSNISGGNDILLESLSTATEPISASNSAVFIPKLASDVMSPSTFMAMASACSAYGSKVYSDVLEITSAKSSVFTKYYDARLAHGCYNGMRMLMAMYDAAGFGSVMALAIVRGYHSVFTVVGHSDEGGYFRDVLRCSDYQAPFGGVYIESKSNYIGMPIPSVTSNSSFTSCVDSILLSSAAICSLSDPGMLYNGEVRASVFSSDSEDLESIRNDLAGEIHEYGYDFCVSYSKNLRQLFGLGGDDEKVATFLMHSMGSDHLRNSRHLEYETVSPFYWIEPTSLFKECDESLMTKEGLGVLCGTYVNTERNCFNKPIIVKQAGNMSQISVSGACARKHPILMFLQNHKKNGLSSIYPANFFPDKMYLNGGPNSAKDNLLNKRDIGHYLWGRGQSEIMHPSELCYVGKRIGMLLVHSTFDNSSFRTKSTHMLNKDELLTSTVKMSCTIPMRIENDKLSAYDKNVIKSRSGGTIALMHARDDQRAFGTLTGFENMFCEGELDIEFVSNVGGRHDELEVLPVAFRSDKSGVGVKKRSVYTEQMLKTRQNVVPLVRGDGVLEESDSHSKNIIEVPPGDDLITSEPGPSTQ